jgi:hypothetical protein
MACYGDSFTFFLLSNFAQILSYLFWVFLLISEGPFFSFISKYIIIHLTNIVVHLMEQPENRRLRRHMPSDLPTSFKFVLFVVYSLKLSL